MSAAQATSPSTRKAQPSGGKEAELAGRFLYYMSHDAGSRRPHRAQTVPAGQDPGRRVRGPRAGGHSGGHRACWPSPATCCSPPTATWPCSSSAACTRARSSPSTWAASGGLTRGRDGNMHMGDMKLNIVSIISAMAACVPVAAGAALALKYKGTPQRGVLLLRRRRHQPRRLARGPEPGRRPEAARGAGSATTTATPTPRRSKRKWPAPTWPTAGRPTAFPAEIVDGNDVFAVHDATARALAHARAGHGPYLLECKTFRMTGHSAHDPADYVPKQPLRGVGARRTPSRGWSG